MRFVPALLTILASALLSFAAHAGEQRFLTEMPTANKTTAGAIIKSAKPGWQCNKKKIGANGNAVNVKGSAGLWFTDIPESQPAADDLIADGKVAIGCKLMEFNKEKHRMTTATL